MFVCAVWPNNNYSSAHFLHLRGLYLKLKIFCIWKETSDQFNSAVIHCYFQSHSPSASTSLIMSCSSASVGFWPSDRITVPSSLVVMVPSPSLSNKEKASLNSETRNRWKLYSECASKQTNQSHLITCMNSHLRSAPLLTGRPRNQRDNRCYLSRHRQKTFLF